MKLVATLGVLPGTVKGRASVKKSGKSSATVPASPALPATPAGEATGGRELLRAARDVLAGLASCARPG
jgi:hypothetical protein